MATRLCGPQGLPAAVPELVFRSHSSIPSGTWSLCYGHSHPPLLPSAQKSSSQSRPAWQVRPGAQAVFQKFET